MEELKRCPFCGNEQGNGMGIRTGTNYVYCQCGVLKPSHGWNSRREEDKLNKIIARMRNEITGMEVALNYYQNRRLEAVARIVELEDANLKLRDELNAIEIITDARFEYRNGELSTSEMVLDTFARLDKAHAELVELEEELAHAENKIETVFEVLSNTIARRDELIKAMQEEINWYRLHKLGDRIREDE